MENASKALIMAGEILIAVLVLTLLVSLFSAFSTYSANIHKKLSGEQVINFNKNFSIYDGRFNITAQEIVTAINFAKQANNTRELEYNTRTSSEYYTTVYIDGNDVFGNEETYNNLPQILNNFLNSNNETYSSYKNNELYFSCNIDDIKKVGSEIKYNYKDAGNNNFGSDIHLNEETGLIDKIYFHTVDPNIISLTNQ